MIYPFFTQVFMLGDFLRSGSLSCYSWLCSQQTRYAALWLFLETIKEKKLDPKSRLGVFLALPLGDQYERVLHEAEYSAVTDHNDGVRGGEQNPNHHKANFCNQFSVLEYVPSR